MEAEEFSHLKTTLQSLATSPMVYMDQKSYQSLSQFVRGYFYGLGAMAKYQLNLKFTYWVQAKDGRKSGMFWPSYIWNTFGKEDEETAFQALTDLLLEFLDHLEKTHVQK